MALRNANIVAAAAPDWAPPKQIDGDDAAAAMAALSGRLAGVTLEAAPAKKVDKKAYNRLVLRARAEEEAGDPVSALGSYTEALALSHLTIVGWGWKARSR